jgi:hypothetical protein
MCVGFVRVWQPPVPQPTQKEVRIVTEDGITETGGLEPTYSAREAAALLGRSYSWLWISASATASFYGRTGPR